MSSLPCMHQMLKTFERLRKEPAAAAGVVSAGFSFALALRKIREADRTPASRPDRAWLIALLPQLQVEAILVQSPLTEEIALNGYGQTGQGEGCVLLFADGSFLFLDDDARLSEDELRADGPFDWEAPFTAHDEVRVLAASTPVLARHPDLDAWAESFPQDVEFDLVEAICAAIENELDPLVDGIDLSPCRNWGDELGPAMEQAIVDGWLGLGIDEPCLVTVYGAESEGGTGYVQVESALLCWDTNDVMRRMQRILDTLVGLSGLKGYRWEYNDGSHHHLSGYSRYAEPVATAEFDPREDFSNHHLIGAKAALIALLLARGMSSKDAEALVEIEKVPA